MSKFIDVENYEVTVGNKKTIICKDTSGEYWIEANAFENPNIVFMKCGWDGVNVAFKDDILLIPASWAKKEYKDHKKGIDIVIKKAEKLTDIK